mmetsp:Transcript_32950/g.72270  ORF Transcript_32950/g.72270 Transcript_32950/m.72270 type:complete len:263 (-) Transcript_32950:1020-1808(-)
MSIIGAEIEIVPSLSPERSPRSIDAFSPCKGVKECNTSSRNVQWFPTAKHTVEPPHIRRSSINSTTTCSTCRTTTSRSTVTLTTSHHQQQHSLRDDLDWSLEQLRSKNSRYGDGHPYTIKPLNNTGNVYYRHGLLDEALTFYQSAVAIGTSEYNEHNRVPPGMIESLTCVAELLYNKGLRRESMQAFAVASLLANETNGKAEVKVVGTLRTLHDLHTRKGEQGEAKFIRRATARIRKMTENNTYDDRAQHEVSISSLLSTLS